MIIKHKRPRNGHTLGGGFAKTVTKNILSIEWADTTANGLDHILLLLNDEGEPLAAYVTTGPAEDVVISDRVVTWLGPVRRDGSRGREMFIPEFSSEMMREHLGGMDNQGWVDYVAECESRFAKSA